MDLWTHSFTVSNTALSVDRFSTALDSTDGAAMTITLGLMVHFNGSTRWPSSSVARSPGCHGARSLPRRRHFPRLRLWCCDGNHAGGCYHGRPRRRSAATATTPAVCFDSDHAGDLLRRQPRRRPCDMRRIHFLLFFVVRLRASSYNVWRDQSAAIWLGSVGRRLHCLVPTLFFGG
uniref:Uncharacterized protein n=1 Tax=Knipowitschia caucasica TaxID=637954 RepID=A0AAV2K1M6_KNICA